MFCGQCHARSRPRLRSDERDPLGTFMHFRKCAALIIDKGYHGNVGRRRRRVSWLVNRSVAERLLAKCLRTTYNRNNLSLADGKFVERLGNSGGSVQVLAGKRGAQSFHLLYATDK